MRSPHVGSTPWERDVGIKGVLPYVWDPPGKPAVGSDAPRRPSSVKRTSMGFLLSWWPRPDANCSGGESSGLPPGPWTVTSKPWLLLSSSVQSRTWGTKAVSPWTGTGTAPVSPQASPRPAAGHREPGPLEATLCVPWEGVAPGLQHWGHCSRSQN